MKLILHSVNVLLLSSTFIIAGGNVVLDEPQITLSEFMDAPIADNYFYTGLSYASVELKNNTKNNKIIGNAITALIGYKFYEYMAIEARYTGTIGDLEVKGTDKNWNISNHALYLKPQYALNQFTLYGLLGYGQLRLDDGTSHKENSIQWGLGANFSVTDTVDLFVDYTKFYDDTGFDDLSFIDDFSADNVNIGFSYNF